MAWRAELIRRKWNRIVELDMIHLYKLYRYNTWYDSLTPEEKEIVKKKKKAEQEKNDRELATFMMQLGLMSAMMGRLSGKQCKYDKYNGIYDEYGFPVKR